MGINIDTMDFFFDSIKSAGIKSLKGLWLMELGNQCMRGPVKEKYDVRSGKSKSYFLEQRCNHHSIDWNGCDGAIPLDLCDEIPIPRFMDAFDIITDFGDMEHVRGCKETLDADGNWSPGPGHWQAWENLHNMGKVGCVYIHTVPKVGSFKNHGSYHFDTEFFELVAEANSYEIIELRIEQCDKRHHKRDYVFCSYVKTTDDPFGPEWPIFKEWLHR